VFSSEMELFSDIVFYRRLSGKLPTSRHWRPPTDIIETDEEYVVKMELAGLSHEAISIDVESTHLIVRGCRHEANPPNLRAHHRMEIRYGSFQGIFTFPRSLINSDISARHKDGFLYITIKKASTAARKQQIEIESEQ